MFAWRDGEIVSPEAVGALRGVGCFETIRIHRGAPFRLAVHVARLERGLHALELDVPRAQPLIEAALRAVVGRNGFDEGLVRFTVAPSETGATDLHAVAVPRPMPVTPAVVRLVVARTALRQVGPLSGLKTTARDVENRAGEEAKRRGAFDAILLNQEGRVVETTARNVFIAGDSGLVTPALSEGALAGVTRAAVIESAAVLDIRILESQVSVDDLATAREVFLTGSGVGVLGVHEIENRPCGSAPGQLTQRLQVAYQERLDAESTWDSP